MSSVERQINVDLDADENATQAIVEERRELEIVVRNMDREEEARLIADLTEIGYKREVISLER